MKSILEELWYGNINPQLDATGDDPEIKNLLELMARNREKLCEDLSDEQKMFLDNYDNCLNEMNDIIECKIFRYAFGLGMRLSIESLFLFEKENL